MTALHLRGADSAAACSEKHKAAKTRRQKGSSDEDDDVPAAAGVPQDAAGDSFFQHDADPFADAFFRVRKLPGIEQAHRGVVHDARPEAPVI